MARQKGIIGLEGTIGEVNFYYRKGVPIARKSGGGFTRELIKHSPSMERVRESNSEFAGCSKINKVFKQAIAPFLEGYKDGTLHSRLMSLFLQIKDLDTESDRGKRQVSIGIETALGAQLFRDFSITSGSLPLVGCRHGFVWDEGRFVVEGLKPYMFLKDADMMVLSVGMLRFDFDNLSYTQCLAEPLMIMASDVMEAYDISIPDLPAGTGVVFGVGQVQYYQNIGDGMYALRQGFGVRLFMEG